MVAAQGVAQAYSMKVMVAEERMRQGLGGRCDHLDTRRDVRRRKPQQPRAGRGRFTAVLEK